MSNLDLYTAKKIGEVLAFAEIAADTFEKGKDSLGKVFTPEYIAKIIDENRGYYNQLKELAEKQGILGDSVDKAEATGEKLRSMKELYLHEAWDDVVEILEWLSFLEGAAFVHYSLLEGKSHFYSLSELEGLASVGAMFHHNVLKDVAEKIKDYASR